MLDRILGKPVEVLDLTSDDSGDPQRMIEIDAILFIVTGLDQQDVGFNFLKLINLNFNYFASDNKNAGTGYAAPPAVTGVVTGISQSGWIFSAAASYSVNIANASDERVSVLARPHLTALNGTPAKFLAGGELVYKVSGNISGDIKPYPFGTTLTVTPTLLRTPAEDGTPRVHVKVEAGRTSVLALLDADPNLPTPFSKVTVASEAVLSLGQTLILSGLSQRESRTGRSGVPYPQGHPDPQVFLFDQVNHHRRYRGDHPPDAPRSGLLGTSGTERPSRSSSKSAAPSSGRGKAPRRICGVSANATPTGTRSRPTASPHTSS